MSSQFRGGGTAFGPVVREPRPRPAKKVRKLALKTALSAKLADGKLVVLDSGQGGGSPKTKELAKKIAGRWAGPRC